MANLISHYDLPGFGTDSNFPALQTVKNNNKIKESNIMKKFVLYIMISQLFSSISGSSTAVVKCKNNLF